MLIDIFALLCLMYIMVTVSDMTLFARVSFYMKDTCEERHIGDRDQYVHET